MTETCTVLSVEAASARAGEELGGKIRATFKGAVADAIIVFASAQHHYPDLLRALADEAGTQVIVGSSSAGEFNSKVGCEGAVSALALRSSTMRFAIGVGSHISRDPLAAARNAVSTFTGSAAHMPYHAALVLTDALAGHTDTVVEEMTLATGGNYRFFGGGAGDDARFQRTHVFAGVIAYTDAVVALEILSTQPLGVGVSHGWEPASEGFRVTEADGMRLVSLNGAPAMEAFEEHAAATGQLLDPVAQLPFFLHNIIGIRTEGNFRLRVPLAANQDGSVTCGAAIPTGAVVYIMKTSQESAVLAAQRATQSALDALGGRRPAAALVFDCVATRLRLGRGFDDELKACADLLEPAGFVGCNTYGQIARAEGQFSGFHNCTAVVCAFPE